MRAGIRGFEFDTLADHQGGAYAYSAALKLTGASNTLISPDMLKPGIKVSYVSVNFCECGVASKHAMSLWSLIAQQCLQALFAQLVHAHQ